MTNLFKRKATVLLAFPVAENFSTISSQVIEISQLRVSFQVKKALTKDPNSCEIKIYNLSESTRKSLPGTGAKVVLRAGYEGTEEQIFIGDVRLIENAREGTEWVTKINSGDGSRALTYGRVSSSFGPGASVVDVLKSLGKSLLMNKGNLESVIAKIPISTSFTQGYVAHGNAFRELEKVLKVAGYELSIQDGALLALAPGDATTEELIELSESSGLIDSPEMASSEKKPGKNKPASRPVLKAKSLLQGQFRCGRRVLVKSRQYEGRFKIVKLEHEGDTEVGEFVSNLSLEAAP